MQSIKTAIGNVRFSVNTALRSAKCMRRIGQIHEGSRDFVRVNIRQITKDYLNLYSNYRSGAVQIGGRTAVLPLL